MNNRRSSWPSPESNPLVQLFLRPERWIANGDLADALELVNSTRSKSVVGHYKAVVDELGDGETMILEGVGRGRGRHSIRVFSKKALVLIAMRARTINAEAFRDWLATQIAASPNLQLHLKSTDP